MNEKTPAPHEMPVVKENKEKVRMVPFIINGTEYVLDRKVVMEALGVKDIVRMQPDDFGNLPSPDGVFSHFNYAVSVNEPGLKYAFMEIKESRQPEPVLILDGARIGECTEKASGVSYEEAEARGYLANSLPGLRDIPSLLTAMIKRYGPTRGLSDADVKKGGLGVSVFRMEGLAPAENVAYEER